VTVLAQIISAKNCEFFRSTIQPFFLTLFPIFTVEIRAQPLKSWVFGSVREKVLDGKYGTTIDCWRSTSLQTSYILGIRLSLSER